MSAPGGGLKPPPTAHVSETGAWMDKIKKTVGRWWTEWLRSVVLIVLLITSFRSAVADWNDVPTGSMKPTIFEGDRIVVNKLAYDLKIPFTTVRLYEWDNPANGDIVVLYSPADGKRLVKRVIGIPGDTVAMIEDRLMVNGEFVVYAPVSPDLISGETPGCEGRLIATETLGKTSHAVMISRQAHSVRSFATVTVPGESYFVMGDNRNESFDSRYFGTVARDQIVGRAKFVAASVDPERHYLPRWERFFHPLK